MSFRARRRNENEILFQMSDSFGISIVSDFLLKIRKKGDKLAYIV